VLISYARIPGGFIEFRWAGAMGSRADMSLALSRHNDFP
jgi:hypothetical protein